MNPPTSFVSDLVARLRLLVALCRPAVIVLLGLFVVTGMAQAGSTDDPARLAVALAAIGGNIVFSVTLNDLADEAIDRVNLPADPSRPLVIGTSDRARLRRLVGVGAVVTVLAAAALSGWAIVVVIAGSALSTAYSLRPIRIADRGAVASLLLPFGYVSVP